MLPFSRELMAVHLPPMPVHLPPMLVHLPPMPVHLPPMPVHLPPMPVHLPPMPVHLPPMPGPRVRQGDDAREEEAALLRIQDSKVRAVASRNASTGPRGTPSRGGCPTDAEASEFPVAVCAYRHHASTTGHRFFPARSPWTEHRRPLVCHQQSSQLRLLVPPQAAVDHRQWQSWDSLPPATDSQQMPTQACFPSPFVPTGTTPPQQVIGAPLPHTVHGPSTSGRRLTPSVASTAFPSNATGCSGSSQMAIVGPTSGVAPGSAVSPGVSTRSAPPATGLLPWIGNQPLSFLNPSPPHPLPPPAAAALGIAASDCCDRCCCNERGAAPCCQAQALVRLVPCSRVQFQCHHRQRRQCIFRLRAHRRCRGVACSRGHSADRSSCDDSASCGHGCRRHSSADFEHPTSAGDGWSEPPHIKKSLPSFAAAAKMPPKSSWDSIRGRRPLHRTLLKDADFFEDADLFVSMEALSDM